MDSIDSSRKIVYDQLVNLITTMHLQKGTLSKEEMHCLLSILDLKIYGKNDYGLLASLEGWDDTSLDPEISEIIKANLLHLDFTKLETEKTNIDSIRELIRYNKELKDR